jgi:hypothetical protein
MKTLLLKSASNCGATCVAHRWRSVTCVLLVYTTQLHTPQHMHMRCRVEQ